MTNKNTHGSKAILGHAKPGVPKIPGTVDPRKLSSTKTGG
jgi:hypothetical protein